MRCDRVQFRPAMIENGAGPHIVLGKIVWVEAPQHSAHVRHRNVSCGIKAQRLFRGATGVAIIMIA